MTLPGKISFACVPSWTTPAFAIPLVQTDPKANATYVQRVNGGRRIVGFDLFENSARTISLHTSCDVNVGDREMFAIVDPNGSAFVGNQKSLSPIVRSWVDRIEEPLVKMSFARFCGNRETARKAAVDALRKKSAEFESESIALRWFIDAILIKDVVVALSKYAGFGGDDILSHGYIRSHLDRLNRVRIDLPRSLLQKDSASNVYRKELSNILEFARFVTGREFDLVPSDPEMESYIEPAEEFKIKTLRALRDISKAGRQEQRLAKLIHILLSDPQLGTAVLKVFQDRAGFAQSAVNKLRSIPRREMDKKNVEASVVKILPKIVSAAFPMQKGQLLLDLANEIGHYDAVGEVIRGIVDKSKALDVEEVRTRVLSRIK